ncbi:MAG: triphosphatase [Paraglaciecola sp.]|jgi:triphosphatase
MEQELELKLLVADGADKVIQQLLLPTLSTTAEVSTRVLANYYYDSPQRALRKHDIGFRIRTHKGFTEQTLKTRGTTIGGLHQRPEYNIPLEHPQPDLTLFANDIWPQDINVAELQKQLCLMFTTNFTRHLYLLTLPDGSQVELVWDKGEIATKQQSIPLCELELELKKGKPEHLFSLARRIAQLMPLRIGNASKAARGYMLVDGLRNKPFSMPENLNIAENASVESAFIQTMEFALGYWQHHEALSDTASSANTLRAMRKGMALVFNTLRVYQDVLHWDGLPALQATLKNCLEKWRWVEDLYVFSQLNSKTALKINELAPKSSLLIDFKDKAEALIALHHPQSMLWDPTNVLLQLDIAQVLFAKPWQQKSTPYQLARQTFTKQYLLSNKVTQTTMTTGAQPWSAQDYIYHRDDIEHQQCLDLIFAPALSTNHQGETALWRDVGHKLEELRLLTLLQGEANNTEIQNKAGVLRVCAEAISNLLSVMEDSRHKASLLMRLV